MNNRDFYLHFYVFCIDLVSQNDIMLKEDYFYPTERFVPPMKKIKRLLSQRREISPISLSIMRYSLLVSYLFLILALIIELKAGSFTARTYELHYLAAELYRLPVGILLISFISAAVINDAQK